MAEYSAIYDVTVEVEIYFDAADDDAADELLDRIGDALVITTNAPTVDALTAEDPTLGGVVTDVMYSAPVGAAAEGAWALD